MGNMMTGPHHALAMAYRDNLTTFAHALQGDVARSHTVALELARPATAEMRRSLDQMVEHHRGAMAAGGMSSSSAMTAKMKDMDTHISALREHMSALEAEVATDTPRAAMVTTHTTAILKECAGMPMMPATAKPHQMK